MAKRVRGLAISTGVTVGLLALAVIAARRTNIGDLLQSGLRGFGSNVGEAITGPFQGLLEGLTSGGQGLGEAAVSLSEGFQKSVSSTLGQGERVFSDVFAEDKPKAEPSQILDLSKFFSTEAIAQRITLASQGGSNFGGFGTAEAQETALQKAIRESQEKYPQFFSSGS